MGTEKQQRILDAATQVFLRYGFKRTTMGDLAEAAGLSRPALYLKFCNKEGVFQAALSRMAEAMLAEIRAQAAGDAPPREKLAFAFEQWVVRPFELTRDAPDARDLLQCDLPFIRDLKARWTAEFEALVAGILAAFPGPRPAGAPGPEQVARVLAAAVHGFKLSAGSVAELRGLVGSLLGLAEASLKA
jgi:AcrR family transcriptional regulator